MAESVIDNEGRVEIPRGIRERLHLGTGDLVSFRVRMPSAATEGGAEIVLQPRRAAGSPEPEPDGGAARQERFAHAMRALEAIPVPAGKTLTWDQFDDPADYVRAIRSEWEDHMNRLWSEDERVP